MKYTIKKTWINLQIQQDITIKQLFDSYYINITKINQLINIKKVMINNEIIKHSNHLLKAGDIFAINCLNDNIVDYKCNNSEIDVLYEDDFVLIVDKKSGIIIHEDDKTKTNNLNSCVANYFINNNINSSIRPIHRLDKDTCGCIIYSKCELFQSYYDYQIENKFIKRNYLAVVKNRFNYDKKTIKNKISKDRHIKNKMVISKDGKDAITYFETIHFDKKTNISLIKCVLQTGRTHQIRVTLSDLNYPIINDSVYNTCNGQMMLCAYNIEFKNIFCDSIIRVKSNYREQFYKFCNYKGEL